MANTRSSKLYQEYTGKKKNLKRRKKTLKNQKKTVQKSTKYTRKIKRVSLNAEKEIARQTEIYSSLRSNTIRKIQRVAKKRGITIPAVDLQIPTARSIKARFIREVRSMAAEAIAKALSTEATGTLATAGALAGGPIGALASLAVSKIFEEAMQKITDELEVELLNYEYELENILTDLKGGEIPEEAKKLYELMKGMLLRGKTSSDAYSATKAEIMYEYTIKVAENEGKGAWMRYAMRFKNYLPEIESIVDRYIYSSGQSYDLYMIQTHDFAPSEERYDCWARIIQIFYDSIYDDSEFEEWEKIATTSEKKAPSAKNSRIAYEESQSYRFRYYDPTPNRNFAIAVDISDLNDV